nr:transposase [Endozoicomonas sp. SESOKO2]
MPRVRPKTLLGKPLHYLKNQWEKLIRYCDEGYLRMDNNLAENAIRPIVVGRKAWLFSNSNDGAKASASLYSLVETAKACGLEPCHYLKTVFTYLPRAESVEDIGLLLPWNQKPA